MSCFYSRFLSFWEEGEVSGLWGPSWRFPAWIWLKKKNSFINTELREVKLDSGSSPLAAYITNKLDPGILDMLSPHKLSGHGLIKLELSFFKDSPSQFKWTLYVCVLCAQSCPTLHNTMNCSWSDSCVHVSRQEYWSGLPFPPPRALPDPGTEAMSLTSPALAKLTTVSPGKLSLNYICYYAFLYLVSMFYQAKHTPNSAFQHATLDPPHTVSWKERYA